MKELNIKLKNHSYSIYIEKNIISNAFNYISEIYNNKKIFIITDDIVEKLYLNTLIASLEVKYEVDYVVIKNGEASKTIETYSYICEELLKKDIRRNNLLIALGGGVVGDITGFVSSTLYRGLPYVGIPTTLLSMVDSSIGGKTGIDFYNRKNILGCFNQPKLVLIDPDTLKTLNDREFNNGMGELIKHGAISNIRLLNLLKNKPEIDESIIYESLIVKKKVVEIDEFDQGERMKLNFGHTFGHIIELKYGYKHGEAVALGMLMAINMGIDLKITDKSCYNDLLDILNKYNLPTTTYNYKDYLNEVLFDKKNLAGVVNFILISKLGNAIIYKISESEVKALNECNNNTN